MEDKENEHEIIPSNDDLPPEPLASEEIISKNINNINFLSNNNNNNKININNINNLYIPYNNNNINSININENQTKNNSNLHDLTIIINSEALIRLSKSCLVGIIIFIRDFCKVKIMPKYINIKHPIFKIIKDRNKDNGHLFTIKKID